MWSADGVLDLLPSKGKSCELWPLGTGSDSGRSSELNDPDVRWWNVFDKAAIVCFEGLDIESTSALDIRASRYSLNLARICIARSILLFQRAVGGLES